jgi:branched-chain amino acid transport system substrate-binding protein
MQPKTIIISIILVVAIVIGVLAYVWSRFTAPPEEYFTVKIGFIFSLTGVASPIGPVQQKGALLAIDEINSDPSLTVNGKRIKIEYLIRDDETKSDVALARLRELIEWGANFIIGTTFASVSAAINQELARNPKVIFIPTNVLSLATVNKSTLAPVTFVPHGTAYSIGYMGVKYLVEKMNVTRIAFFAPAYAFGWDQWKGAKAALDQYGDKVQYLYIESPVGTPDFTPYLNQILAWKPQALMFAHWGTDAINLMKQLYESGVKAKIPIIWFNWHTVVYDTGVPAEALENVYGLISYYYNMTGFPDTAIAEKMEAFARKYYNKYGEYPDPYAAFAYLGVWIAVQAVRKAGTTEASKVAQVLENMTFDTFKGTATFRKDHQMLFPYAAFIVRGKGPAERSSTWDILEVIGAYKGSDYLPPLEMLGYT